ncbi:MAG TPA: hypothetical protein VLV83_23800 [Acidobacteriota bacterium]|nr:hypothetical protein [Acidobacteriota bacterium]
MNANRELVIVTAVILLMISGARGQSVDQGELDWEIEIWSETDAEGKSTQDVELLSVSSDEDVTVFRSRSISKGGDPHLSVDFATSADVSAFKVILRVDGVQMMKETEVGKDVDFSGARVRIRAIARTFCIEGRSDGVGWSWGIVSNGQLTCSEVVPRAPEGVGCGGLRDRFVTSLATAANCSPRCFAVPVDDCCFTLRCERPFRFFVGDAAGDPDSGCEVTNNPAGCEFNPCIFEVGMGSASRCPQKDWHWTFVGTAQGGMIRATISGPAKVCEVVMITLPGQSAEEIAFAWADLINGDSCLGDQGIGAVSDGGEVRLTGPFGEVETTIDDAGLNAIPMLGAWSIVIIMVLLTFGGIWRLRTRVFKNHNV